MALLSFDVEMARARIKPAFSTGEEYEGWLAIWCEECRLANDCPLMMVALLDRTPVAWELRDEGAINKYTCTEYQAVEEPA